MKKKNTKNKNNKKQGKKIRNEDKPKKRDRSLKMFLFGSLRERRPTTHVEGAISGFY